MVHYTLKRLGSHVTIEVSNHDSTGCCAAELGGLRSTEHAFNLGLAYSVGLPSSAEEHLDFYYIFIDSQTS